jgi:hypothetical protein
VRKAPITNPPWIQIWERRYHAKENLDDEFELRKLKSKREPEGKAENPARHPPPRSGLVQTAALSRGGAMHRPPSAAAQG